MRNVLNVPRSGYYDWIARSLSGRRRVNTSLDRRIGTIFAAHRQRHGAPRITQTFRHEGHTYIKNRIARRMRTLGLKAIQAKKFSATTDLKHSKPSTPDWLKQNFCTEVPN